ncbi:MAG TPA: ubiquinone/menaquinone biosynthesis methyltransferase [Thermoanaerobaculia bacterium]
MRNKYLSYDEQRAPRVREMFSRLAERYDLVNDVMSFGLHRRWKAQTVRLAANEARRPMRWLDLCCGTGDMALLAANMPGVVVTAADFTLPMLAVARRRTYQSPLRNLVQGDALRLPFANGVFGVITVGYGLRNLADLEQGLSEMRRVLAPGGRAVILDFGKPDNPVAGALYHGFLYTMMPTVGWLFHGDPQTYLYIPESLKRFPGQRGVKEMMQRAGFVNARYEERLLGTMGINVGEAP